MEYRFFEKVVKELSGFHNLAVFLCTGVRMEISSFAARRPARRIGKMALPCLVMRNLLVFT